MAVVINGDTGITSVNGTAGAPSITGTDTDTGVVYGTNTVSISTGGTERVRVDSSGNVGVGVTPSAWASNWKVLELPYGSFRGNAGGIGIGGNVYNNTSNVATYKANGRASSYDTYDGGHYWYTAASGTAGNAISFTQAMTLDASGNLGVGTTSVTGGYKAQINGNLLLSSTSPLIVGNSKLTLLGDNTSSTGVIIDSSGNLLVGTTSTWFGRNIVSDGSGGIAGIVSSVTDYSFSAMSTASSGNNLFVGFWTDSRSSPSIRGSISYNRAGGLTVYNTTSDYRSKTVNGPVQNALDKVAALKPSTGRMNGAEIDIDFFVAHELQEIVPSAVTGEKDAVNEDGTPKYQMVDKSALIPLLTAAIQEQQAIINAQQAALTQLQADVAALKGQ